jgi:hypothetical protein
MDIYIHAWKKMECRNKWSRATENFCPCFEASKPSLDTAVTREAKTLLQTWIDAKFASDCLMGFRFAFTCCFVKTFLMERAPFISTRGALEPSTLILGNPV